MAYLGVTVDGIHFRVRIIKDTYREHIDFIEGPLNGDMESGRHERDLKGVAATFYMSVAPDDRYPEDYDALWRTLREPVDAHSVTVFEDQGELSYFAQIQTLDRTYDGMLSGRKRWKGMTLAFVPSMPQWRPAG